MVLFAGAGVAHNNDVVHDAGRAQRRLEADADTRGRGRLGVVARTTRVAERQRGQRQGRAGRGAQSVRHDAPLTCDASVVLLTGPLRRESPRRGDGTACAAPGGAARAARWRPNPRAPVRSLSHPPSSPRLLSVPSCGCAAPALTFFFFAHRLPPLFPVGGGSAGRPPLWRWRRVWQRPWRQRRRRQQRQRRRRRRWRWRRQRGWRLRRWQIRRGRRC